MGYFDTDDETQLIADTSSVRLGAVLEQINADGPRAISYASKSLSEVESRLISSNGKGGVGFGLGRGKVSLLLVWTRIQVDHGP